MFKKKKCPNCKEKIKENFDFCPSCGFRFNNDSKGYGMLGKNDFQEKNLAEDQFLNPMAGGILGKMLNNTMKMLEKELQKEMKNSQNIPLGKTNFELVINGKRVDPRNIKVSKMPFQNTQQTKPREKKSKEEQINLFSKEQSKKFTELPREEPVTASVRRFSNKIIYEIEMPEVKTVQDVTITKLENSIEVKALGKTKSYFKIIHVGLPVVGYSIEEGKLILELGEGN